MGNLNEATESFLKQEMGRLTEQIKSKACLLAQARVQSQAAHSTANDAEEKRIDDSQPNYQDIAEAFDETIGRREIPVAKTSFFDLFPPFTLLCFSLCIVFGAFGLFGGKKDTNYNGGFLDISKIFAGAIVGSATTSILRTTTATSATGTVVLPAAKGQSTPKKKKG